MTTDEVTPWSQADATVALSFEDGAVWLAHLHLERVLLASPTQRREEAGVADAEAVVDAELVPPVPEARAGPVTLPAVVLQVHGPRLPAHPQHHLALLLVAVLVLELRRHVLQVVRTSS